MQTHALSTNPDMSFLVETPHSSRKWALWVWVHEIHHRIYWVSLNSKRERFHGMMMYTCSISMHFHAIMYWRLMVRESDSPFLSTDLAGVAAFAPAHIGWTFPGTSDPASAERVSDGGGASASSSLSNERTRLHRHRACTGCRESRGA